MEIESRFQQPKCDLRFQQPIISGQFILRDIPTTLSIYQSFIKYQNYYQMKRYQIDLSIKFQMYQRVQNIFIYGIRIYIDNQILQFQKHQWIQQQYNLWEQQLLKFISKKDFHQYFNPVKKIGTGNFASVYLAQRIKDKLEVAVKAFIKNQIYKQTNGKQALKNQISILRNLNSQNIIKIHGVYQTQRSIYVVQQFAQGRNLARYIQKIGQITITHRKNIMKGILRGLADMDYHHIIHRDIKPQNIIYSGNSNDNAAIKIVDFGLATLTTLNNYLFVRCGTPGYVAPQIINIKDTQSVKLDPISDVFSAGVIFFQLIFNKILFDGSNNIQILELNRQCNLQKAITPLMKQTISIQEYDLLIKMLEVNPYKRIRAEKALNHSYFQDKIIISQRNKLSKNQLKFSYGLNSINSQNNSRNTSISKKYYK